MSADSSSRFEFHGRFVGFFRDVFGKRRMVLQVAGEEIYLKVQKELRRELDRVLVAGQEVIVVGHEEAREHGERARQVVTKVRVAGAARACVECPIRVCAKKNCWRQGGQELWRELERQIESAGLSGTVRLKAVGCMDECKRGANAEVGGRMYHRCTAERAEEILKQFAEHAR